MDSGCEELVVVVLLNWNSAQDTIECIKSINKSSYLHWKIVLCDNNSDDVKALEEYTLCYVDRVVLLKNNQNLGFAEGCNVGIRKAINMGAKYIFLLNNDTIINPKTIERLISLYTTINGVGILGCKIYYYDHPKTIWFAGEYRSTNTGFRLYYGRNEVDSHKFSGYKECNNITGCAMMIPVSVLEIVGLFDNRFFAYSEDVDLCIRVKKAGYKIFCDREAHVWHKESLALGVNSPEKIYFSIRNRLLVISKHCTKPIKYPLLIFQICYMLVVFVFKHIFHLNYKQGYAVLCGIVDFMRGNFNKGKYADKF